MSPQLLSLDIQVEIIKRLPVKSLIQFRSVCKAWKSLIDSSHFIAGYVCHDQPQHLMMSYRFGEEEVKYVSFVDDDMTFPQQKFFLTIPHLALEKRAITIDSSHGLLCMEAVFQQPNSSKTNNIVLLWNPTIRKSIAVVVPKDEVRPPFRYVIGFGVSPDTKDPKLVKISHIDGQTEKITCQVMVFTLSSGEWTCLSSNQLPRKSIEFIYSQTVIGQFIYWLAIDHVDGEPRYLVMSFDLSTYEFGEVHLPHTLWQKLELSVSRLRDSLVLLEGDWNHITGKRVCNVWMMEHGDQKVLTKLFTIKAPHASVLWTKGFRNNGEAIIEVHDNDEDEHMFSQSALVVYDPCLEHIKDLGIHGNKGSFFGSSYTYTESLLLLNHDDGHIVECGTAKS